MWSQQRRILTRAARPSPAPQAMGAHGAAALLAAAQARGRATDGRLRVLTHCNTGSLATAAYGTALGVIRALHERGQLEHAYCCETRPYNQVGCSQKRPQLPVAAAAHGTCILPHGCAHRPTHTKQSLRLSCCCLAAWNASGTLTLRPLLQPHQAPLSFPALQGARLTAYELVHDGLPSTLICDSAAAALMDAGKVDAVVVGADRIAANGDTGGLPRWARPRRG